MDFNRSALSAADAKRAAEAQRLERTKPKPVHDSKRFARWALANPLRPKETVQGHQERYLGGLPRGTCRVICNVICQPTPRAAAKGRRSYHAVRVVDRRVWNKLDDAARARWIDDIRREVGA